MQNIPIQAIPNQSFSIVLDGNRWNFVIKTTNGATAMSLARNGVSIIDNLRSASGAWIIPAIYEEAGNFIFITQNFQLPDYKKFGTSQYLIYASADDLAALRLPPSPPITDAFFNPIAPVPLRFRPQGY